MNRLNINGIFLSALAICATFTFAVTTWAEPAVTNLQQRGKLALKKQTLPAEIQRFSEAAAKEQDPKEKARLEPERPGFPSGREWRVVIAGRARKADGPFRVDPSHPQSAGRAPLGG